MLVIRHFLATGGGSGVKEGGREGVSIDKKAIGPQPFELHMENRKWAKRRTHDVYSRTTEG